MIRSRIVRRILHRNLEIIWDETTDEDLHPDKTQRPGFGRRFVAKGTGCGSWWGVWDKKEQRFLRDAEVAALGDHALRQNWPPH